MQPKCVVLIGSVFLCDLEKLAMTIIVFLIDNSALMKQRTFQGTTLLDVAKSATELFFKIRMAKSRVDRYFVLTLDADSNYVKLTGWKQNVDLQSLHAALNEIKADGQINLSIGIQRAFRMLNLNRLQLGLENYGMGLYPSYIEPAVVVCITGSSNACCLDETIVNDPSLSSLETMVLGNALTSDSYRWDYRMYSIVLRFPGFTSFTPNGSLSNLDVCLSLKNFSEKTGGESFEIFDTRELQQCLEALVSKCHPGVVLQFSKGSEKLSGTEKKLQCNIVKQLMLVKIAGRVSSSWPLPEPFWPDEDILSSQLPPRSAHPVISVAATPVVPPDLPEYFPIDRYELASSSFTQDLLNYPDPNVVWQCFSCEDNKTQNAPFGYLKVSQEVNTVHFHVLPYNYPLFTRLLIDLCDHHMRMTESWGHQFVSYLNCIPKYYFMPLAKSFERFGFLGMIKPDAIDRAIPYQLKHALQKLRQAAKSEYDKFVCMTQSDYLTAYSLTLPSSLLPLPLWPLREFKPVGGSKRVCVYPPVRPGDIPRHNLRSVVRKMKLDLINILEGKLSHKCEAFTHQQPIALMGDYLNYKTSRDSDVPLREINPSPERSDTFGNPFRRKSSSSFIADEGFVDEMGPPNMNVCNPNASMISPARKKSSPIIKSTQLRTKGPLPPYINHLNWRCFSPRNSTSSSPNTSGAGSSPNHDNRHLQGSLTNHNCNSSDESQEIHSKTVDSCSKVMDETPNILTAKESFKLNKEVLRDLVHHVRQPHIGNLCMLLRLSALYTFFNQTDTNHLFNRLNDLTGSLGQRDAVVSLLMSEALRFRRSCLHLLLSDWRNLMIRTNMTAVNVEKIVNQGNKRSQIQLNGWT